jgi:hypothetical protein
MNKDKIIKRIEKEGYKLGTWDNTLNKLNTTNLKKVLDNIKYQSDTKININRKSYIVEMDEVDGEIDLNVLTLSEYESRYGEWED